jgi:integrase
MNPFSYNSPLKQCIQAMINEKRALGYKYDSSARLLYKFDQFCLTYGCTAPILSKELVLAWCQKHPNEAQATYRTKLTVIRQLAMHMDRIGMNAFVLPLNYTPKGPKYVPYIFSNKELTTFFEQTDSCHYCAEVPHRQWIMPLLFRMLYSCGLRISEALNLKMVDVNLQIGVLTIIDGKFNKDRLVPISPALQIRCYDYVKRVHAFSDEQAYFFPALNGKAVSRRNAYSNFRKFLWQSRISHGGWGKGPRVHDFRHTFAVHCMRYWVFQGKDLAAYLPILKTYLGHHSFSDTAQYLRLTAELYPDITKKMEVAYGHVIPITGGDDETN